MQEWLIRRIKKAGENIESTLTQIFFLALLGGSVAILALSKKALSFALQLAITATPLWATISLTLLCCLYVYLRTQSYTHHGFEPKPKLSKLALHILAFFGQQQGDVWVTTKNLSTVSKTSFNQTQLAIDQLLHFNFLYVEAPYGEDPIYWLSTEGRAFLEKEKLL